MTAPRRYGLRSLRFKLVLASVVIEALMLTVLVWNSTRITGDALQEIFRNHVEVLVPLLNVSLANPLVQRDYATLEEQLKTIVNRDSLAYVEVRDEFGELAASNGTVPETVQLDTSFEVLDHIYDQAFDITLAGRVIGRARYGLNVSPLEATLASLRNQGALVATAEIVLTILLLATLGALLTRHLLTLAQAARALQGGDYSTRVPVVGRDEVADTAQAFNAMADTLARDLIERKRAEEALKQSEQRLRNIMDGLGPSMFMGLLTTAGVVLETNQQALAAAGLKPEDVLGKPVEETYWFSYSEASKRQMRETIARAARGEASRYDVQIRAAENQFIPLDFSVQPFRDASGRVVLLVPSAIVITERKRAELKLQENSQQLEILSRRLLAAQETERRHIARELHDEIGQLLTVVKLNLQTVLRQPNTSVLAPALKEGMESIDRVIASVRELSLDLRPSMLDDLGLIPTLRWYVQRQTLRFEIDIALTLPPALPRLASEIETACFRIVQEALTNIARHASATHITVTLAASDSSIALTVQDDGQGFDVATAHQTTLAGGSFGLLGMQERAELAGGTFRLASGPGQGTTIEVHFPLPDPGKEIV